MASIAVRRVTPADRTAILAGTLRSAELHRPWVTPPRTADDFHQWIEQAITGAAVGLVVTAEQEDAVIGVVNFTQIVLGRFRSTYTSFYAMAGQSGRGLMTSGLKLAIEFGVQELGVGRFEANIRPENARSIALVKRVGFKFEGYSPDYLFLDGDWRDHERWTFLARSSDKRRYGSP